MRIRNVKNKDEIIENSSYVIEKLDQEKKLLSSCFKKRQPLYIEIGMGKGKFLIENAKKHPNINYIGIEKQKSILAKALKKLEEEAIDNLYVIASNALEIDKLFDHEVDRLYLNFSDPWPKNRHQFRRLTSKVFLEKYEKILTDDAKIYLRTDNDDFFAYSLVSLSQNDYVFEEVNLDLHRLDCLITTEYEDKFSEDGKKIKGFIARKK